MLDRFNALDLTRKQRDEIEKYYALYHKDETEPLTREDFLEFSRTGNRVNYENKYFARRHRINGAFMMSRMHGGKYADELFELLEAVCSEETWALPAHVENIGSARETIDLFAAETAMMLSEIVYLLGDSVPNPLAYRIEREIRERVFEPFSKNTYPWENARHNWSAVCAGAIGITYMRLAPEELPLSRLLDAMDAYMSGYTDDGACLEGVGYWSYGFSFFLYFAAELLKIKEIDILHSKKAEKIAAFGQDAAIFGETFISCSDAPYEFTAPEGFIGLLEEFYGVLPVLKTSKTDECGRWAHYIRSYLYPARLGGGEQKKETVFHLSQMYICRREKFGFFIKGGSNGEPHNHNDVGGFIIADETGELLCDIGMGEYTRDYFDEEKRYNYLCCSSLGHSVPIIGGYGQLFGKIRRCDLFECGNGAARVSFGNVYGRDVTGERRVRIFKDRIALCDSFTFTDAAPRRIIERFVTLRKPVITETASFIGHLKINRRADVTVKTIHTHDGNPLKVFLLDFDALEFEFTFV